MNTQIGFIGQGWIGKHYADDFEARGYKVVRYALEAPYAANKSQIANCEIVFIAVPTPTTPKGFSSAAVVSAIEAVADGSTVVIKSTLIPGETERIQAQFPHVYIMHSPEFLVEATAAFDAANPQRNIVGITTDSHAVRQRAQAVLDTLPEAPFSQIMTARDAELVKYAGNCFLYTKVVYMNILYDIAQAVGGDWEAIRGAVIADPRIGDSHTNPIHISGHEQSTPKTVRGAGGHCFIKDYEALRQLAAAELGETHYALEALLAYQNYNNQLLKDSGKDADLLAAVHGQE